MRLVGLTLLTIQLLGCQLNLLAGANSNSPLPATATASTTATSQQQQQQQQPPPQQAQQNQQQQANFPNLSNAAQYVVLRTQSDPKTGRPSIVNIIPITVANNYEPRIELRYQSSAPYVTLDDKSPNNTVVAGVVVFDEDSGPSGETSLSLEHGNELNHFQLVSTSLSNTIRVNGAPLSRSRVPEYNLTIVARDHGQPQKSSSVNLIIKLLESNQETPLPQHSKPPVTNLIYIGAMLVIIFSSLIFLIIIACAVAQST